MAPGNYGMIRRGVLANVVAFTALATLFALPTMRAHSNGSQTPSQQTQAQPGQTGQERLLSNLKAAGVEQRATIQTGDMRKLPFEAATFDAVVSTYAVDHLGRVLSESYSKAGGTAVSTTFTYDAAGNRTSFANSDVPAATIMYCLPLTA